MSIPDHNIICFLGSMPTSVCIKDVLFVIYVRIKEEGYTFYFELNDIELILDDDPYSGDVKIV